MVEDDDYPVAELEEEDPLRPGIPALVITHGCMLLVCSLLLIFTVPKFVEMFMDFAPPLPGPTQFVVRLSDVLKRMPYLGVLAITVFLVADAVAYGAMARRGRGAGLAWFWLMTLVLVTLPVLIIAMIFLPLHRMGVTVSG